MTVVGVSRNNWRENDPHADAADAEYRAKRPAALAREQFTCRDCKVISQGGMEIHHQDCNHANNDEANLGCACVLCHPVNHIGELSSRHGRVDSSEVVGGGGVQLGYLPDLSQADLSNLFRTIGHVLQHGTEAQRLEAESIYQSLCAYSQYVEAAWGTSSASYFAIALKECSPEVYEQRAEPLRGIRVLFTMDAVRNLSAKFSKEFASLPLLSWGTIAAQRTSK